MCKKLAFTEFWDSIQDVILPNKIRQIGSVSAFKEYGNVIFDYFNTGNGISLVTFDAVFNENINFEGVHKDNFYFLSFNMGEELYVSLPKNKKNYFKMESNSCWNGRQYDAHKMNGLYSKNKKYKTFYIIFNEDLFSELFKDFNVVIEKKTLNIDGFELNFNNYINLKQKVLLDNLLEVKYLNTQLQALYLESKILELVYVSINELKLNENNKKIYLNSKDIESLQKAKKILLKNMINPPSLKELSYKSAINEFKLKKGFKQLFGNTVFGFLQEYRLNEAKKLLETNEINIGEASLMVGYKSISHFSKIFKEYYGITPIEIKKEQKKIYI